MDEFLFGGAGEVYLGAEEGATPLALLEEVSLRVSWPGSEVSGDWEGFASDFLKGRASVRVSALARLVPEGNPLWRAAGGLGWARESHSVPEGGLVKLGRTPVPETLSASGPDGKPLTFTLLGDSVRFPREVWGEEVEVRYAFESEEGFSLRFRGPFSLLLVFPSLGGGYRLVRLRKAELVGYEELHQREDFSLARLEFVGLGAPEVSWWKG